MVPLVERAAGHLARGEPPQNPTFAGFPSWTRDDESEDEPEPAGLRTRRRNTKRRVRERGSRLPPDAADAAIRLGSSPPHQRSSSKRSLLRDVVKPIVGKLVGKEPGNETSDNDNSSPESEPPTPTASAAPAANPPPPPPPTSLSSPSTPPASTFLTPQVTSTSSSTPEPARPSNPPPVNNAGDKSSQFVTSIAATKTSYTSSSTSVLESATSISISSSAPTTSRFFISLTPVVTAPIPFLSSDVRKGVQSPATQTSVASLPTTVLSTATTSSSYSYETAESDKMEDYPSHAHDNLHANTEKALIAVGSVGATIIVFFVAWLSWKCFKMRRGKEYSGNWMPASFSFERPKQIVISLASRVPVLKDKLAKRTWSNLEKPYDDAYWEKQLPYTGAASEKPNGITVHTAIVRESVVGDNQGFAGLTRHGPSQSISSTQPQFNNTLRSNYQVRNGRMSEISSLSSGFGDGDIIMPPPNAKTTITAARLTVPAPAATRSSVSEISQRRETMYTEASEDPIPRFRSINSWVRQQTGRVKRAKQREVAASDAPPVPNMPPEQEFRLMMPDGEEPRRAQVEGSQRDERGGVSES